MVDNMDEDIFGLIICLILILFIVLVITVGLLKGKSMNIELEKYKIQMEVLGEPIEEKNQEK